MRVAITGALCSGKSVFSASFVKYGFNVIIADEVVSQLMDKNDIRRQAGCILGLSLNKENWRKLIAGVLFRDGEVLREYGRWFYPLLFEEMCRREIQGKVNIWEVPLLFEVGWQDAVDYIVLVCADRSVRKERAIKRGMREQEFEKRDRLFFPDRYKEVYCDYVVVNNGDDLGDIHEYVADICGRINKYFRIERESYEK